MLAALMMLLSFSSHYPLESLLGSPIEEAKRSDFFTFFHLKETGAVVALENTVALSFEPEAGQFRKLVSVYVTLDTNNRIVRIDLNLARSFVDHKTNGIFARDIAKSLLRAAIPKENQRAIADLANEIEFPAAIEGQTIITVRPPPKLPPAPTAGYLTYLGKRSVFEQMVTTYKLRLENRKVNDVDSLLISVQMAK